MHYGNGFPVVGLSKVDIPFPFKMDGVFFDDFISVGVADFSATAFAARYYIAGTNVATAVISNLATSTDSFGVAQFTTAGASGDEIAFANRSASFLCNQTASDPKPIVFQTRMCTTSISSASAACGIVAAAGLNGATEPIDTGATGFYFVVVNGAVSYTYTTSLGTVGPTALTYEDTGVAVTVAASVMATFSIRWDGVNTIEFFVNGRRCKKVVLGTFTSINLCPFAEVKTTAVAAKTLLVDYLYAGVQSFANGR